MNRAIEKTSAPVKNLTRVQPYVIQREINLHKVDIDRKCFAKTDAERHELKVAKSLWKKLQAKSEA